MILALYDSHPGGVRIISWHTDQAGGGGGLAFGMGQGWMARTSKIKIYDFVREDFRLPCES